MEVARGELSMKKIWSSFRDQEEVCYVNMLSTIPEQENLGSQGTGLSLKVVKASSD